MKKVKLNLKQLSVSSFVTQVNSPDQNKGGTSINSEPSCIAFICEPSNPLPCVQEPIRPQSEDTSCIALVCEPSNPLPCNEGPASGGSVLY